GPKTSIICSPMTSLKTSIKTITYLSDTGCLEIQGASLLVYEWHEYVGWEGMECGIFFESDHTHQQLQALGLLELAQKMVTARIRYDELKDKAENFHEITEDDIFKMLIIHCDQLAREVDSILLQFVKDNIDVFPCRHNRHEL
ncbi:hypothetical protein Q5545_00005, partial [Escherichia coli]|nr:hypothetical protein [Escherichia coli]